MNAARIADEGYSGCAAALLELIALIPAIGDP
jgi:hypothetical protein